MQLLLIEDDEALGQAVDAHLRAARYGVQWARSLADARQAPTPDMALLDLGLPDGDGLDLQIEWRRQGGGPTVIVLTAPDQVRDRIRGLQAGADDYLLKPFDLDELLARIAAVARRSPPAAPKVHLLGDANHTPQPKAGHIANQEVKVCADALIRAFQGLPPDPAPVTNSACFSTITQREASWLNAVFQYDASKRTMVPVAAAGGASLGWSREHFEDMGTWFRSLMAESFA